MRMFATDNPDEDYTEEILELIAYIYDPVQLKRIIRYCNNRISNLNRYKL